jgi:ABC-2 type transport system permease protein
MTMTVATTDEIRPGAAAPRRRRAGLAGTARSEFTKIVSVRSTYWTLVLLVVISVAWSITFCAVTAAHWAHMSALSKVGFDPTQDSVIGLVTFGQLVIVVLGALTITGEHSTQAIRTSLTVMPRRGVLYGAKGAVFATVAAAVAFPASFLAWFTGQRLLASTHAAASLGQPNVLKAILASAIFVVLCGLFSFGLGALIRSTAGTITAAYGVVFLLPQMARGLPTPWYDDVIRWLPGGQFDAAISTSGPKISPYLFTTWGEMAVFAGYTVVALVLGAWAMHRKDA